MARPAILSIILLIVFGLAKFSNGVRIREARIGTANCNECGMTVLGQLSLMVCGNNSPKCCVAANLDNNQENWIEGGVDTFAGGDLKECYDFDLGEVPSDKYFSLALYHAMSDGGQFDFVEVLTNTNQVLTCKFKEFLDGQDFEIGSDCRLD